MTKDVINFDILILGTGLSGMRAAYSALQEAPELEIGVVSIKEGPSGSSFCNVNEKLGMLVPLGDREREIFVTRAKEIAFPGHINDSLLHIQAEEGEKRFLDLVELGVGFERGEDNKLLRYPACFLPEPKCAVIIENVRDCFSLWFRKLRAGVNFLFNFVVVDLLVYEREIAGALLFDLARDRYVFVRAKCVICSLGGAASLLPWKLAWHSPFGGYVFSLFSRAGVSIINNRFIQFLWVRKKEKTFFSMEEFCKRGIITIERGLLKERMSHCPIAYNMRDFVLDRFLLNFLTPDGLQIREREDVFWVVPAAQVSHGGASIDEKAMTGIWGLFACGECASGMHGANRVGGAMVLASQVFGHRAGRFAARLSKEKDFLSDKLFTNLMKENNIEQPLGIGIYEKELTKLNILDIIVKAILLNDKEKIERVKEAIKEIEEEKSGYIFSHKMASLKMVVMNRKKE